MIRSDGSPGVGPTSDLEASVLRRAAFELSVPLDHVFLHHSGPRDHGGELWSTLVGLNDGPGTDTTRETWSYWNKTYEEGLRRVAARDYVWDKPWQENLREEILYLPWDSEAAWFREEEPAVAWSKCPNGRHLLWVLGHDPRLKAGDPGVRALARDISRLASDAVDMARVHPSTRQLHYAIDEGEDRRLKAAERYAAVKDVDEYRLEGEALRSWHFDWVVLYSTFATLGNHTRLDYAAYHAGCLEYAVWRDGEDFPRQLADLVRKHFPNQLFTH